MDQSFSSSNEEEAAIKAGQPEISLRPFDLSDVDDFMVWATDDQVSRFCRWETYTLKEDALNYIKDMIIPHPWFRAICLKNRPIGAISVHPYHGEDRCRGEIGYVLASKHWGRGIATIAVKMVLDTVFKDWPHLERLEGLVDVENLGSQRVLEKAGFLKEGVLRKYFIQKGRTRDMVLNGNPERKNHNWSHVSISIVLRWIHRQSLFTRKLSDIDDFMTWTSNVRTIQYTRLSTFTSKEHGLKYLKEVAIPLPWHRSISLDNCSIGFISIFPGSGEYICKGDIGYALASQYWGQGIATVVVKGKIKDLVSYSFLMDGSCSECVISGSVLIEHIRNPNTISPLWFDSIFHSCVWSNWLKLSHC